MRRLSATRWVLLLAGAFLLPTPGGAASKSPTKIHGEPQADQALVYFIREARFLASARTMFLYADQTFLGIVDNNSYTFAYVAPGKHLFWLNWAKINDEVELEAGKTYYFTVWDHFTQIDEEYGKTLIEVVKSHIRPEAKEEKTAEDQIRKRYVKAEKYAAKKPDDKEYVGTQSKREEHVAKWPKVDLGRFSTLHVEDFAIADPDADARKKQYMIESAPRRLADQVASDLGNEVFSKVERGPLAEPAAGVLVLRGKITQYKPGSETARLMLAGTGSAHLDFEAQLIDGETGEEITHFSGKRTWAWGGAYGASRGIDSIEKNVAYEIALYLERCKTGKERAPDATEEPAEGLAEASQPPD